MPIYQMSMEGKSVSFLFVHVPKTGGTAIETYLSTLGFKGFFDPTSYMQVRHCISIPPVHFDYEICNRLFRLERMYSFAVVRNPLERMVSQYRWTQTRSMLPEHIKKYGFSQFIEYALEQFHYNNDFLGGHLKPQSRFIGPRISRVFRYEEGLESIIKAVLDDIGLAISGQFTVPRVNKSDNVPLAISEQDKKKIREFYSDDYAQFGY